MFAIVLSAGALIAAMLFVPIQASESVPSSGAGTGSPVAQPVSMPSKPVDNMDPPSPAATDREAGGGVYIETTEASREDLEALFAGLEDAIAGELIEQDPIVVVLHGADAGAFVRQNYARNKMLVDQAALLDSYGLIDVRMCTTWLVKNGFDAKDLPPYIDTVRYARDEVNRLVAEGFTPYGSVDL